MLVVAARAFEPPTPRSRTECATRLSHAPTSRLRFFQKSAADTIAPFTPFHGYQITQLPNYSILATQFSLPDDPILGFDGEFLNSPERVMGRQVGMKRCDGDISV